MGGPGTPLRFNPGGQDTYGYFVEQIIGRRVVRVLTPDESRAFNSDIQSKVLVSLTDVVNETECQRRGGTYAWAGKSTSRRLK